MIKYFLTIVACSISLCSCDFLDFDESTGMPKDEAYGYIENLTKLTTTVYSDLPTHYSPMSGAMRESATDNSVYTWDTNDVYDIYANTWSPLNTIDTRWAVSYDAIRRANSFFENYSEEKIERFKWDPNYTDDLEQVEMYYNELRILRAYFHFELAMRYGDIAIMDRTYSLEEINSVKKSPFHDVIAHIVDECDTYAPLLPVTHKDFHDETGRATRGFAMALKAKALLFAASPLHNPQNDKELWKAAAIASYDIIKEGWYTLPKIDDDPLYDKAGGNDVLDSPQLIFESRGTTSSSFEKRNMPYGFEGADGGNTPTQNFVDAFNMADGTPFDWNNEDHVKNMYYNADGEPTRDPRFYLNIICNGMEYMDVVVETFEGGKNGFPIIGATKTGYYLRKLMNETVSFDPSNPVNKIHHYPLFRYAEILLNYAEAMTEWGGADFTTTECPKTARIALNEVRDAADMSDITATGDLFTEKLRNERRVELAFENHRFWDIRRWKIGDVVKNIYGIKIKSVGGAFTYERELIQTRTWDNKMYLYPIPQDEIYMNNNLLPQNTGW